MGQASEMMIEEHNALMATDEQYAADYEASLIDAWREAEDFEFYLEQEKFEDFFDDYRVAADGYEEIIERKPVLVDDDIPF
ncbi:MAG TPA: hypothetical protein VF692_03350 [Pyrinomonadaceae bacterium]|jgi:D-serine dehydratase